MEVGRSLGISYWIENDRRMTADYEYKTDLAETILQHAAKSRVKSIA